MPGLGEVARPKHVVLRRPRPVVGADELRQVRAQKLRVPQMAARDREDHRRRPRYEILRRGGDPGEERTPDRFGLRLAQTLERHPDVQPVAEPQGDEVAPVRIEQVVGIKCDETPDQPTKGGVGRGLDRGMNAADKARQIVRLQGQPRDDAEAAAAAAFKPPEQIAVGAGIGDPHGAVRGDDFGFQQARRRGAELLRKAAEPAGLHEARDTDGAGSRRPARGGRPSSSPRCRRGARSPRPPMLTAGCGGVPAGASLGDECVVQRSRRSWPASRSAANRAHSTCRDSCDRRL